jgi:hypothetical protein
MTFRQGFGLVALSALLVVGTTSSAVAQTFGVGGGISQDPDQVFLQGLVDQRGLGTTGRIGWRPNVQLGFGNDLTTLAGNVELVVWIPLPNPQWSTYVGAGPSLNILFRGGEDDGIGENDSEVGGGASMLAGIEHERGFFAEIRYGGGNAAGLKLSAGILLRR